MPHSKTKGTAGMPVDPSLYTCTNPMLVTVVKQVKESLVYVLQLQQGYIYVGKSVCIQKRFKQHCQGNGASFTRHFKPTGKLLRRSGTNV